MRSSVLKAKLITLTQPENFRFQLAACGKAKKFSDRKIACGRPDIVGDRPSAGMISDYCDFTMSSTFSPTGQLLDVKRVDDRKSARLRRPWAYQEALLTLIEAKLKGFPGKPPEVTTPLPVIDLMAALKRSLAQNAPPSAA